MKKRIKNKWLKALRSGRYKQGVNCLVSDGDYYCCLGVLEDLFCREQKASFPKSRHYNASHSHGCARWSELPNGTGHDCKDLQYFNDRGDSFDEIANWIEKNL